MKKRIPLELLELIQPLADSYSDIVQVVKDDTSLFKLVDTDPRSSCYFQVVRQENKEGKAGYIIKYYPRSKSLVEEYSTWVVLDTIPSSLDRWYNIIKGYNSISTIHDDPILKQYEDEFYNDFRIVEEDAKQMRFNFSQQLLLTGYLDKIEEYLEHDNTGIAIENKSELKDEINELKKSIGVDTKDGYIRKQAGLWAKFRKYSVKGCEFIIKEFSKEVIKEALKRGINIQWEQLPSYIQQAKDILI